MSVTETITNVWNGLDDETRRRELSHWRGVGKWADDERWKRVGRRTVQRIRSLQATLRLRLLKPGNELAVLEWGPGGGSNAFAFREIATQYYGVDISDKNLSETSRMLAEVDRSAIFKPILLTDAPSSITSRVEHPIDVFLSTAVFQHFPSKEYGLEVLEAICAVCKPGAVGIIQIRYDNGDKEFQPIDSLADYRARFVRAVSYQLDEFWTACENKGFRAHFIGQINPKSHYATFFLSKHYGA